MHETIHVERHFTSSEFVRDVVIGMSDGLTVPFALAAGLSGTTVGTRIVVMAGLAEIAAGSIAMGLGGYLAARSDAEHYASELAREEREVREKPEAEVEEVETVFTAYGLTRAQVAPVIAAFRQQRRAWVDFMMRYELGLERPDPGEAMRGALTIAGAYIVGGLIPLAPYFVVHHAGAALGWSVTLTLIALFVFGFAKGRFTGAAPLRSALQTTMVGG